MATKKSRFLTESALIGALYAVLTLAGAQFSFGPVQFRFSEALTVLPILTPAAVSGLFVGCIVSNFVSTAMGMTGAIDILFGSVATLLAAVCTRAARNVTVKGVPWLSFLPPIILNAILVGAELSLFLFPELAFWYSALTVGLGECAVVLLLGVPLYFVLRKTKLYS